MKRDNFDDELELALGEFVENFNYEPSEKAEFSKEHEDRMEDLFKSLEESGSDNVFVFDVRFFVKVAIFVLLALLATIAVTPSMRAWRPGELQLFGEESGDYGRVLHSDGADVLETQSKEEAKYINIFGYLPEEYVSSSYIVTKISTLIEIRFKNTHLNFKFGDELFPTIDTEFINMEEIIIDNICYTIMTKDNNNTIIWNYDNRGYVVTSNLELDEILLVIKNIKYEEIVKKS